MAVFQRMFFPDSTFHSAGGEPVPTPLPEGPRNCGQLPSAAAAAIARRANILVFIRFPWTARGLNALGRVAAKGYQSTLPGAFEQERHPIGGRRFGRGGGQRGLQVL